MKSVMDEKQIEALIQKLFGFERLDDLNMESITSAFSNIDNYYKTRNTSKLNSVERQIANNFKRRREYNSTNILVYSKNLEKYIRTEQEATSILGRHL